jgi:hypothetical protein
MKKRTLDDILSGICKDNFLNCSYIKFEEIHNFEQYNTLVEKIIKYYKNYQNNKVIICNDLINLKNVKYALEKKEEISIGINFPLVLMIPNFLISAVFSIYLSLDSNAEHSLLGLLLFYLLLVGSILYFCNKGSKYSIQYQKLIIYIDTVIGIVENIKQENF